jgi:hypothetical protein
MGGFRDLLALLLGWKSARTAVAPFRVVCGQVWHPGALVGRPYLAGQQAGHAHTDGKTAGQIHG